MTSASEFESGSVLAGQFRIRGKLAEGGMGAMYLADQLGIDRLVAIKVVHSAMAALQPELLERFNREARALAQIQHPNVVQLYALGQTASGLPFLAMEYASGHTLAADIARGALLPIRALTIAGQIASALAEAHRCGVIHRDLKPANIMLTHGPRGEDLVKVVDFGIAKLLDAPGHLTVTGSFFGTPRYVSPEQARSQPVDARTDIYSLGLVLYEMLTGAGPFAAEAPFDLLAHHLSVLPEPPSSRCANVPAAVDAIVLRCLEKQPERRFASADDLVAALAQAPAAVGGMSTTPAQASPVALPTHTPWVALRPVPTPSQAVAGHSPTPPAWDPAKYQRMQWQHTLISYGSVLLIALGVPLLQHFLNTPTTTPMPHRTTASDLSFATANPPSSVHQQPPSTGNPQLSAAAVRELVVQCLNLQVEQVHSGQADYVAWAGNGPTPHAAHRKPIFALSDDASCQTAVQRVADDAELDATLKTQAQAFGRALSELASLTHEAAPYFASQAYRRDAMRHGRVLHGQFLAAFERFGSAERALRGSLAARSDATESGLSLEPRAQ